MQLVKTGDESGCPELMRRLDSRHGSRNKINVIENRLARLECNMEQVLELLIQQNNRQCKLICFLLLISYKPPLMSYPRWLSHTNHL